MNYLSDRARLDINRAAWTNKVDFLLHEVGTADRTPAVGTTVTMKTMEEK